MKKILQTTAILLIMILTLSLAVSCNGSEGSVSSDSGVEISDDGGGGGGNADSSGGGNVDSSGGGNADSSGSGATSTGGGASSTGGGPTVSGMHRVTFDLNYEGAPAAIVVYVEYNDFVDEPDDPIRANYRFLGWFSDRAGTTEADFERTIKTDMVVYASWELTTVYVTFDLNYEGAPAPESQQLSVGTAPLRPENPVRDDHLFIDWYTDKNNRSSENIYDFSAAYEDLTVYAGWEEKGDDTVSVTYMLGYKDENGDDVVSEQELNVGAEITLFTPDRENGPYCTYDFIGWQVGETVKESGETLTVEEDIVIVAKWTVVNVFEAEFTDMSLFSGLGWSWTRNGTTAICYDRIDNHPFKAGYNAYVGNMNMKGSYLYWEFDSDRAVENVTLKLRLSIEAYFTEGLDFTPQLLVVTYANETESYNIDYEDFHIANTPGLDISPFENFLITTELDLVEGKNYIVVSIGQDFTEAGYPQYVGKMGSMAAPAPVIDSIIIEHEDGAVNLTWTPLVHNLWNYGYDRDEYPCPCPEHSGG